MQTRALVICFNLFLVNLIIFTFSCLNPFTSFYSFFPFQTISVWVHFHFLCLNFKSIVDWMKQGWVCESHLWIILIGQSDIVKVITFWNLPNVLFTLPHNEPHLDLRQPGKSGYSSNSIKSGDYCESGMLVILVNMVIMVTLVNMVILSNLAILGILLIGWLW